jgi:hypothetical protein
MAHIAGPLAAPLDAADIVDAVDAVDLVDIAEPISATNDQDEEKDDADFDAFGSAKSIQGETVADAQAAAAAEPEE